MSDRFVRLAFPTHPPRANTNRRPGYCKKCFSEGHWARDVDVCPAAQSYRQSRFGSYSKPRFNRNNASYNSNYASGDGSDKSDK